MDAATTPVPTPYDGGLSPKARVVVGLTWAFTAFAIQAVGLRFYLRPKFNQPIALDDWIMLLALVCQILFQSFLTLACTSGLGYPIASMTVDQIIDLSKWSWCTVPVNILANVISRISIAIVLVQIFGVRRWFRRLIIGFTAFLAVLGFTNFIFVFFQASPFQAGWDPRIEAKWRLPHRPHYILIFTQLVVYTISDFIFSFFPITFIWKLSLATRKKVALVFVMAGSFVSMAAAISRAVLVRDTLSPDADSGTTSTLDEDYIFVTFGVTSLLASVEVSLIIILGSLPKLSFVTKLGLYQSLSSSFNSMISRFRSSNRSNSSSLEDGHGLGLSDKASDKIGRSKLPRSLVRDTNTPPSRI